MYIYRISNSVNAKVYIGKTNNPVRRWREHKLDSISSGSKLYRAMRKHGLDNFTFEIIYQFTDLTTAYIEETEALFVQEYNSYCDGYNSTPGGGGNIQYKFGKDHALKSGSAARGKKQSLEHIRKRTKNQKGHPKPAESVARTAEKHRKKIICFGIVFNSVTEAAAHFGIPLSTVSCRLRSKNFSDWNYY